jgi:hypothetical protein
MVSVRSRYFHLAFERIFSDFRFVRSSRRKMTTFYAYVDKVKKKEKTKKTRAGLHKCCASHRIKKKERKKTRAGLHECYASHRIKKRKKGRKLAQDYMNAVLRTALKKGRKLAQDYMNAVLRTALKRKKTRAGLHECYASHRIKNK